MTNILIPDYAGQQVISGIRTLSRSGNKCTQAWRKRTINDVIFKSRYISKYHDIVPASINSKEYYNHVVSLCKYGEYDIVIPFGNDAYYSIVMHDDGKHINARYLLPHKDVYKIAHDKTKTYEFCIDNNIDVPKTYYNYSCDELHNIARSIKYPVVIKARSGTGVGKGLRYANSEEELMQGYNIISSQSSYTQASNYANPMIQEYIPGYIHDACVLALHGKPINILTQVRWIMYPIYGGVGAVNVTTNNNTLKKLAQNIIEKLGWNGPAQLEFKYDYRDNKYKLIEINPKLWGTLDLSIKAGMDFPVMIKQLLTGERVEVNKQYAADICYKFCFHQYMMAYIQLRGEYKRSSRRNIHKFRKIYYDIDIKDIMPDIYRALKTMKAITRGRIINSTNNLPSEYLNTVDDDVLTNLVH